MLAVTRIPFIEHCQNLSQRLAFAFKSLPGVRLGESLSLHAPESGSDIANYARAWSLNGPRLMENFSDDLAGT